MNNYSYNLSGTQIGRFRGLRGLPRRSDRPNLQNLPFPSYTKAKYPDFVKIFKTFHQSYPSVSAFHQSIYSHYTTYEMTITDSIHHILATPPAPKSEWRDWGSKYKWDYSDFNAQIPNHSTSKPKAPQSVVVMKEPIDLIPLESFRTEINFPLSGAPTCDVTIDFKRYLDGVLIRPLENACKCEMRTLMRAGCQCGGQ